MSRAKLLINKFEDGNNFKTLQVTITEEENFADTKFGEWIEGIIQHKKKEKDKSSRLVVKIVSGEESKKIELDSCAKEINDSEIYLNYSNTLQLNTSAVNCNMDYVKKTQGNSHVLDYIHPVETTDLLLENKKNQMVNQHLDFSNPLEYSLRKVKENNARIMQNIHMLNRTLNYTKKKEILDIICPKSMRTYPCDYCGKCFVYDTGLRRHYLTRHAIVGVQPRWQVVWTCVQCFQVWPQHDQAAEHSIQCCKNIAENHECVREIKTSLLLQCEFCEKVFTSIPRLLRHSKVHTTLNNYECNECQLSFVSYEMAEQHWTICPWLKSQYCFSLPRMLLCNGCDRKFRGYEQLYCHRYKVGHFMTKIHASIGNVKSFGVLVYQCELCGQWCSTITDLINHRNKHQPVNE